MFSMSWYVLFSVHCIFVLQLINVFFSELSAMIDGMDAKVVTVSCVLCFPCAFHDAL